MTGFRRAVAVTRFGVGGHAGASLLADLGEWIASLVQARDTAARIGVLLGRGRLGPTAEWQASTKERRLAVVEDRRPGDGDDSEEVVEAYEVVEGGGENGDVLGDGDRGDHQVRYPASWLAT